MKNKKTLAWMAWGLAALAYFFQNGLFVFPEVLNKELTARFSITPTEFGMLSAVFLYSFSLLQIPAGLLFDRYRSKPLIVTAYILMIIGAYCMIYTPHYAAALIGRLIMGIGASLTFVGALYLGRTWFTITVFPIIVGITEALSAVGQLIIPLFFALLKHIQNWRFLLLELTVIMGILALLSAFLIQDNTAVKKQPILLQDFLRAARNKKLWVIAIYGGLAYAHYLVVVSMWGVPFLVSLYHIHTPTAVLIDSAAILGYIAGCCVIGKLSHFIAPKKIILYSITAQTIFYFIAQQTHFSIGIIALFEIIMGFMSSHVLLTFVMAEEHLPRSTAGVNTGFIYLFMGSIALILIPIVGTIYGHTQSILYSLFIVHVSQIVALFIALYMNFSKLFAKTA